MPITPKKVAIGLSALYMGDVDAAGGLGTALTAILYTKAGTAVVATAAGTKTDFPIEESTTPYYSSTEPGVTTVTFSLYGMDALQLKRFFGGTYTAGASGTAATWEAAADESSVEMSIVLQHSQGGYLAIPRAAVAPVLNWAFQKAALPQIDFTCTVLIPTNGDPKMTYYDQGTYAP